MTHFNDATDLEECMHFASPIKSTVMPRWQRKALAASPTFGNSPGYSAGAADKKNKKHTTNSAMKNKNKNGNKKGAVAGCTAGTPRGGRGRTHSATDRFIPNRAAMDMDVSSFLLKGEGASDENADASMTASPNASKFQRSLATSLFGAETGTALSTGGGGSSAGGAGGKKKHRVLAFRRKAPAAPEGYHESIKVLYSQNNRDKRKVVAPRHIPSAPERVLDAPEMIDDYYLNLVDWSNQNVLAVALANAVYLWDAGTGDISELCVLEEESYVSSLKWVTAGAAKHLAVATSDAEVQLWDVGRMSKVRTMRGHKARIGAMSWNNHILSSGSRDTNIFNHDVRVAQHHIQTLAGHKQEVCGLTWAPNGRTLASGGNDNLLCLWDARRSGDMSSRGGNAMPTTMAPRCVMSDHMAAVKALAWCPFKQNLLASGGGTADKSIKFWNTLNGECLNSIDTGSQVCSLLWNPNAREILSSHGFSQNQLCLWSYPSMAKIAELNGHTARVLHLAGGPAGDVVCSAGADETLRFWNVFGGRTRASKKKAAAVAEHLHAKRTLGSIKLR